jgi:hypothetical protein
MSPPFWKVLTSPRVAFPGLAERPTIAVVLVMGSVWGIERNFHELFKRAVPLGEIRPLPTVFAANVGFGIVFGISIIWLASWVFAWCARRLGGAVSSTSVRVVLAWSAVPHVVTLLYLFALFFAQGQFFLLQDRKGLLLSAPALVAPFLLVQLVCSIWSVVLAVVGLSELAKISVGRSIGAYLLGGLMLLVPLVAGTLGWASLQH